MHPGSTTTIEYRRQWANRMLVHWLGLPGFFVLVNLIWSFIEPSEWIPGAPLMLVCLYAWLVLYLGRTKILVNSTSFELNPGPLPAGLKGQSHPKSAVKRLYRLRRPLSHGGGDEDAEFLAAVELNDGARHLLHGPFPNAEAADVALKTISMVWGHMPIDAPKKGSPADEAPELVKVFKFWAFLFGGTFLWGAIVHSVFF